LDKKARLDIAERIHEKNGMGQWHHLQQQLGARARSPDIGLEKKESQAMNISHANTSPSTPSSTLYAETPADQSIPGAGARSVVVELSPVEIAAINEYAAQHYLCPRVTFAIFGIHQYSRWLSV
jgi:hypothetical protein